MTRCNHAIEAPFEAPWHAQVFALTVALSEAGHFPWPEWAAVFSVELKAQGAEKDLNGSDDYYVAWVAALEKLVATTSMALQETLAEMKAAWTHAYEVTPHGAPVIPDLPEGL